MKDIQYMWVHLLFNAAHSSYFLFLLPENLLQDRHWTYLCVYLCKYIWWINSCEWNFVFKMMIDAAELSSRRLCWLLSVDLGAFLSPCWHWVLSDFSSWPSSRCKMVPQLNLYFFNYDGDCAALAICMCVFSLNCLLSFSIEMIVHLYIDWFKYFNCAKFETCKSREAHTVSPWARLSVEQSAFLHSPVYSLCPLTCLFWSKSLTSCHFIHEYLCRDLQKISTQQE